MALFPPGMLTAGAEKGLSSDALGLGRSRRGALGSTGGTDEVAVMVWFGKDCLLEQPVEEQAPVACGTSGEAEAELVEVCLEMIALDGTLMGGEEPSLHQGGDTMDPGEGYVRRKTRAGDVDRLVGVILADSTRIGLEPVGEYDGARFDVLE